jgi:demethylmenaquinone methyltransferase/2-methoxy-6-polyprenyl-1,4-benzoquinol methylase
MAPRTGASQRKLVRLLGFCAGARFRAMTVVERERAHAAAKGAAEKGEYVRGMFEAIAPRYDLLNRLLSFRMDRSWRRAAIAELDVERQRDATYLDLCAGTLDVAAAITDTRGFTGTVVGADFSEGMLRAGRGKPGTTRVAPVAADALRVPLRDDSCAGAIVAFGIRNVVDLDAAIAEVHRVLEPRGRFVILEFTTPRNAVVRAGYHAYFHHVLPRVGALVSGHATAYSYLPVSVAHFPDEQNLGRRLEDAGFREVRWRTLMLGVVAIHVGLKEKRIPARP